MIIVNNKSYIGKSIIISNGKIIIDGKDITPNENEISIEVNGNIEFIDVDNCNKINVTGNCTSIKTQSGDIEVKSSILGNVQTMSGDVYCEQTIHGNVSTMSGDIKTRK
jgi:hypothetical protein